MSHTVVLTLRFIAAAGLVLLAPSLVGATELVRAKPLMEYADILLAQELDIALSALDEQVTQCVDAGQGSAGACLCRYHREAEAAKAAYEKTLEARPKWQGKILYWKNTETLASRQLIMPAIGQHLQSSLPACAVQVQ